MFSGRNSVFKQGDHYPMKPRISYLICATPRCGDYLLFEALENTGIAGNP